MFSDRHDAGRRLASKLGSRPGSVVVLGLPRGGVPVAYEVAEALSVPLDVFVVRKLGVPGHEELAFGAVASGGVRVLNGDVIDQLRLSPQVIDEVTARELEEVGRREQLYRGRRDPIDLHGRTVVLIDDGLATGATMRAAARAVKPVASRVIIAAPVGAPATCSEMHGEADEVVTVEEPPWFYAVGQWYRNFEQVTDAEVRSALDAANKMLSARAGFREREPG